MLRTMRTVKRSILVLATFNMHHVGAIFAAKMAGML
jgi:hypothetical protein